ncbi:MAG: hypothetical protein ACP5K8_06835 [Nitrososphaeria archaeon]
MIEKDSVVIKILSITERNLQACIKFLIDISKYILSKLDVEVPETYIWRL